MPPFRAISLCSLFVRLSCGFRFSSFTSPHFFRLEFFVYKKDAAFRQRPHVQFSNSFNSRTIFSARSGSCFRIRANSLMISHSLADARSVCEPRVNPSGDVRGLPVWFSRRPPHPGCFSFSAMRPPPPFAEANGRPHDEECSEEHGIEQAVRPRCPALREDGAGRDRAERDTKIFFLHVSECDIMRIKGRGLSPSVSAFRDCINLCLSIHARLWRLSRWKQ